MLRPARGGNKARLPAAGRRAGGGRGPPSPCLEWLPKPWLCCHAHPGQLPGRACSWLRPAAAALPCCAAGNDGCVGGALAMVQPACCHQGGAWRGFDQRFDCVHLTLLCHQKEGSGALAGWLAVSGAALSRRLTAWACPSDAAQCSSVQEVALLVAVAGAACSSTLSASVRPFSAATWVGIIPNMLAA